MKKRKNRKSIRFENKYQKNILATVFTAVEFFLLKRGVNTLIDIKKILGLFLDLIYPPRCIICDNIFEFNSKKKYFCDDCESLLKIIDLDPEINNRCKNCSRPIESGNLCSLCVSRKNFFDKNYSLFIYDELISNLIHKFKFKNHPYIGYGLSKFMADKIDFDLILDKQYDYIFPIPIHRIRRNHRGFNQAEILARDISKKISVPVNNNILLRVKNTKPQWHLNSHERENNLLNAFRVKNKSYVNQKNIILIDDIFTTGSTINKCSEILKAAGANYIFSLTLSITIKKSSDTNNILGTIKNII